MKSPASASTVWQLVLRDQLWLLGGIELFSQVSGLERVARGPEVASSQQQTLSGLHRYNMPTSESQRKSNDVAIEILSLPYE